MARLRESDVRTLLELLEGLWTAADVGELAERSLAGLRKLLPSDTITYSQLDLLERRVVVTANLPDVPPIPGTDEIFWQYRHQHPLCARMAGTGDGRAVKISDFLTYREGGIAWSCTKGSSARMASST